MKDKSRKKVRYAVVGLGWFAQEAALPAFANARDNSELAALVTGDPTKAKELSKKYGVPAVSYDDYDSFLASGKADAVYIALPNSHHREYTERAARAGVHVLCEKPMADNSADCQAMIDACKAADVRLMIAYRLHFEEANLKAVEVLRSGKVGEPRVFSSVFTQQVEGGNIRLDRELGGGPVEDIGIYCINATRYLFRAEPTEVTAYAVHGRDERFKEVPESVAVMMRFPGERLATFVCGFGEAKVSHLRVVGTRGELFMDPAYTWHGDINQTVVVGDDKEEKTFEERDQVAAEFLYFSDCVLKGKQPEPDGLEGLIDVKIIEAIRTSYQKGGAPVKLEGLPAKPRPTEEQSIERPAAEKPELVKAASPAGK
jgi:predicted dehydrogenase